MTRKRRALRLHDDTCERNLNNFSFFRFKFCHCLRKLTHRQAEYSIRFYFVYNFNEIHGKKSAHNLFAENEESEKKKRRRHQNENVLILDWIKAKAKKRAYMKCVHKINKSVYRIYIVCSWHYFIFLPFRWLLTNGNKRRRIICYYFYVFFWFKYSRKRTMNVSFFFGTLLRNQLQWSSSTFTPTTYQNIILRCDMCEKNKRLS